MRQLLAAFFLSFILALPIQAKQDTTEPASDLFSKQIGEYISNIKPWESNKLWLAMYRLHSYVQKNHPETIEYLENNADNNANFSYILLLLEEENNFDTNRDVIFDYSNRNCTDDNDRRIHILHTAAQQEHAAALYQLSNIYFCRGDISQSFDYYRRAFYAGYYELLSYKKQMDVFRKIYPQHIADMENYAKSITSGDFFQLYRLMTFYYYRKDKEVAQHFYKLADEKAPDLYRYRLASFNKPLARKVVCNEKEINAYRQSILAGNIRALEDFIHDCKADAVTQKIATEGLQRIEKQVNARILAWQAGHMDYKGLFDHITVVRRLAEFYENRFHHYGMMDLQKADDYYRHLIQLGNTSIFNELGDMWLRNAVSPIYKKSAATFTEYCQKAHDYFLQGSRHNQSRSIEKLALFYLNGQCVVKDEAQSIQYQEKLSVLADVSVYAADDLLFLAFKLNEMGYFSQAKKYAQQLADYGEINAMQLLAQLWLVDQDNLEIDEQKAQFWYEKTFEIMRNDPSILGYQYIQASKDFRKARFNETADTYWQRAIELLGDEAVQKILQEEQ